MCRLLSMASSVVGPGQRDAVVALQAVHQARPPQHFGVQAFDRQEQDGEVGGVRRAEVALADGLGFGADARLQRARRDVGRGGVGAVLRVEQALVVVARELGIDRQPDRRAVVAAARKPDREVHPLVAARLGFDLLGVLLGRQHLLEQGLELHFAEHAARLDVGQHALQVAHALRQRLHFAQALVHLLQPVGHLLETLAQPRLQRGLQFFVDGLAHLVELGGVGLLQQGQLRLQRAAHFGHAPRVRFAQVLQLQRQACPTASSAAG